jgi:hypothetical protein
VSPLFYRTPLRRRKRRRRICPLEEEEEEEEEEEAGLMCYVGVPVGV